MKTKTNELTGAALDWAVAKCEGEPEYLLDKPWRASELLPHYSTDWAQGGPIIERENIAISSMPDGLCRAYIPQGTRFVPQAGREIETFIWRFKQEGPTPLIAAMRCYVASKLGDEVEIPEELQ